jgi:hypothetical protein
MRKYSLNKKIEALITHLDQLPVKQQLCYGDLSPGKILLRDHDAFIIDYERVVPFCCVK